MAVAFMPGGRELREGSVRWLLVALWGRRGRSGLLHAGLFSVPAPTAERARAFPSGLAHWQWGGASVSSPGCLPLLPLQTCPLPNWEPAVLCNYLTEPLPSPPASFCAPPRSARGEVLVALTFIPGSGRACGWGTGRRRAIAGRGRGREAGSRPDTRLRAELSVICTLRAAPLRASVPFLWVQQASLGVQGGRPHDRRCFWRVRASPHPGSALRGGRVWRHHWCLSVVSPD